MPNSSEQRRQAHAAVNEKNRQLRSLTTQGIGGELQASEQRKLDAQIKECEAELSTLERAAERLDAIADAHGLIPPMPQEMVGMASGKSWPTLRGELYGEQTYRPDAGRSFFADMVSSRDDPGAAERIGRNQREVLDYLQLRGDVSTTSTPGMGGIVPPVYLYEYFAQFPRSGRPFADAVGSRPLIDYGMEIAIPRLVGGTGVTSMVNEADAVDAIDANADTVNAPVVTIAGEQDVSRQAIERTLPNADVVLLADLLNAYDQELDRQLLVGTGSSGQHRGLANVSSTNSVTYTSGSPSGKLLVKQVAHAASDIAETRFLPADLVVMHPRRAAYLSSEYDSDTPVLPSGSTLARAVGFSSKGGPSDILGLPTVFDPNIPINGGAGTNQDEMWVVRAADFLLFEQPIRQFKYEQVLSGTLQIRLQVYAYSCWFPHRWPESICSISGTGLVTPTWT